MTQGLGFWSFLIKFIPDLASLLVKSEARSGINLVPKTPDWDGVFGRSFLGLTALCLTEVDLVNTTLRLDQTQSQCNWPTAPYRASVWRRVVDRG